MINARLALFPKTTAVSTSSTHDGSRVERLFIGDCDVEMLASEYGTPLYCYDSATLNDAVNGYRHALSKHYPDDSEITYAGKAFLCVAMAQWTQALGLWLDCTGAGEIHIAVQAGVPREKLLVHGVNKSSADIEAALRNAGTIVVDHLAELERLSQLWLHLTPPSGPLQCERPELWLRARPGVAVDTHTYTQTGQEDSKFGMGPTEIIQAVRLAQSHGFAVSGLHFHQGSHFDNPEPIAPALEMVLDLVVEIRDQTDWIPEVICPGGGWGVAYHEDELPHPPIDSYVEFISKQLVYGCRQRNLPLPKLHLEPGRSLVAQAGVAVYQVGAVKETENKRWLMIDGGLADNPRPALYQARYSALPVVEPNRLPLGPATFAGPYCESGDILIHDLTMPAIAPGEYIAVPVSGAYQLAMGSNYNGAAKPVVLWLEDGTAHVIQKRQEVTDLTSLDLPLPKV